MLTSHLSPGAPHEIIGNSTFADPILDRLLHNSNKISLKGESMREKRSALMETQDCEKP